MMLHETTLDFLPNLWRKKNSNIRTCPVVARDFMLAHQQKQNADQQFPIADRQKQNADQQFPIADQQKQNADQQFPMLTGKSKMLISNSQLLVSKGKMLLSKSQLLIGKSKMLISGLAVRAKTTPPGQKSYKQDGLLPCPVKNPARRRKIVVQSYDKRITRLH